MTDDPEERQEEIKRIEAAANAMAKLMNGRFVLDRAKLQAFAPHRNKERLDEGVNEKG